VATAGILRRDVDTGFRNARYGRTHRQDLTTRLANLAQAIEMMAKRDVGVT